jgi:hypothetical protein
MFYQINQDAKIELKYDYKENTLKGYSKKKIFFGRNPTVIQRKMSDINSMVMLSENTLFTYRELVVYFIRLYFIYRTGFCHYSALTYLKTLNDRKRNIRNS